MSKRYFYREIDPSEMGDRRRFLAQITQEFAEEDLGLGKLDISYIKISECPFDRLIYIVNELDGKKYKGLLYDKRICGVAYHESEKILVRADLPLGDMLVTILHEARHIYQKYNPSDVDKEWDAERYEKEAIHRVYGWYKRKLSRGGTGMYNASKLEKLDAQMDAILDKMSALVEKVSYGGSHNELLSARRKAAQERAYQFRASLNKGYWGPQVYGYETKLLSGAGMEYC